MSTTPDVPRDKYKDDHQVPISGARVSAAIQRKGWTVSKAAKLSDQPQSTLNSIVQGHTERCRLSRRQRLSDTLGVSPEWLGGEPVAPYAGLTPWAPNAQRASTTPIGSVDENFSQFFANHDAADPPGYHLDWGLVAQRIVARWREDITESTEAEEAFLSFAKGADEEEGWRRVVTAIQRGLAIVRWSAILLKPRAPAELPKGASDAELWEIAQAAGARNREESPTSADADNFASAGATAVLVALRLWLEGRRDLNYPVFVAALDWLYTARSSGFERALREWARDP